MLAASAAGIRRMTFCPCGAEYEARRRTHFRLCEVTVTYDDFAVSANLHCHPRMMTLFTPFEGLLCPVSPADDDRLGEPLALVRPVLGPPR